MTSKLKVNLINDAGDNNLITSDGSGSVTLGTAFPAKFGQIIYGTYNTATNTSSTSYVDTGLNANITPSATSSKASSSSIETVVRSPIIRLFFST